MDAGSCSLVVVDVEPEPGDESDRPWVRVALAKRAPESYVRSLRRRRVRVLGLREDLLPRVHVFASAEQGRAARVALEERLRRREFVVNGDTRVYRVYVIELAPPRGARRRPAAGYVYVGETTKTPEQRLEEHVSGEAGKAARATRNRCVRLRYDLFDQYQPVYSREASRALEREVSIALHRAGYRVSGDGMPLELRRRRQRARR